MRQGVPEDILALTGYVIRKVPPEFVAPGFLIADYVENILGRRIETDVLPIGLPQAFVDKFTRRVPGGATVNLDGVREFGTLGGWLIDDNNPEGKPYLLSCW